MMANNGERNSYHRRSPTITNVRGTVISSLSRIPGCAGRTKSSSSRWWGYVGHPNSLKRNHHHDQESKLKHLHQNKPPPNAITTPLQYHRQKSRTKYTTTRKPPPKNITKAIITPALEERYTKLSYKNVGNCVFCKSASQEYKRNFPQSWESVWQERPVRVSQNNVLQKCFTRAPPISQNFVPSVSCRSLFQKSARVSSVPSMIRVRRVQLPAKMSHKKLLTLSKECLIQFPTKGVHREMNAGLLLHQVLNTSFAIEPVC